MSGDEVRVRTSVGWRRAAFEGWARALSGPVARVAMLEEFAGRRGSYAVDPGRIHPDDLRRLPPCSRRVSATSPTGT